MNIGENMKMVSKVHVTRVKIQRITHETPLRFIYVNVETLLLKSLLISYSSCVSSFSFYFFLSI